MAGQTQEVQKQGKAGQCNARQKALCHVTYLCWDEPHTGTAPRRNKCVDRLRRACHPLTSAADPQVLGSVMSGSEPAEAASHIHGRDLGQCLSRKRMAGTHGSRRVPMNTNQFRRWLKRHGCTFETHRRGSGHLTVRRGDRVPQLPTHGSRKQPGTGLVKKIKRDPGLE